MTIEELFIFLVFKWNNRDIYKITATPIYIYFVFFSFLYSMHGFGLEETRMYGAAEKSAKKVIMPISVIALQKGWK